MAWIAAGPGRPKGSVNKAPAEVRAAARAIIDDPVYREALRNRIMSGSAPAMETLLWHYGYGKPKETIELSGEVEISEVRRLVVPIVDVKALEDKSDAA